MTPSPPMTPTDAAWPSTSGEHAAEAEPWRSPPASAWVLVAATLATLGPMLLAIVLASP